MLDLAVGEVVKECNDGRTGRRASDGAEVWCGSIPVDTLGALTRDARQDSEVAADGPADGPADDEGCERTR
jgi:hypothetical protein